MNSVGIVTARDHFVIAFDKSTLRRRIQQFTDSAMDDMIIAKAFDLKDTGAWKLKAARKLVASDEEEKIILLKFFIVRLIQGSSSIMTLLLKEVVRK